MSKSIVATFEDRIKLQTALEHLSREGYSTQDVSILVSDESRGRHFEVEQNSKAPEGAATGGVIGGALGALGAGLTAVGTVASGGSLLAAGPLVAAMAGLGAGGATGGIVGSLVGLGFSENEATLSSKDVEKGSILVGINTEKERVDKVKEILKSSGATNITTQ